MLIILPFILNYIIIIIIITLL